MSDGDKSEGGGSLVHISLGKEIDRSIAEMLSGLLTRPATEVGNLVGDWIGQTADRIRAKRILNAELGMQEVRKKLEASQVGADDVASPKAEDIHLLIEGLSLSDDETMRDLWAGLFSKALDPNSKITAERPFISVLRSLSPLDAKIIGFLAFIHTTDLKLRQAMVPFQPRNITDITEDEKATINKLGAEINLKRRTAIDAILSKAKELRIDEIADEGWSDNLMRQGILERVPPREYAPSTRISSITNIDHLHQAIMQLAGDIGNMQKKEERQSLPPKQIFKKNGFGQMLQLEVRFTGFGKRFSIACGLLDLDVSPSG